MKDLKQELEKLSTTLDGLKEAIDHNFGLLNIAIGNIIEKANEKPGECRIVPFDIEKAKQGAKVVTRDGHDVRILCYDRHSDIYPIVAVVQIEDSREDEIISYTNDGKYFNDDDETGDDLFIKEECV